MTVIDFAKRFRQGSSFKVKKTGIPTGEHTVGTELFIVDVRFARDFMLSFTLRPMRWKDTGDEVCVCLADFEEYFEL